MKNIYLFALLIIVAACSEDSLDESNSFTKIYDTQRSDASFNPIDIVEADTGFIVLSGQELDNSAFMGVQLIQLDDEGDYLVTTQISGEHVIPVGEFITIEDRHYFFSMNPTTNAAQLVSMGNDASEATTIALSGGIQFPLAANKTSNGELLLLSYNPTAAETVLARFGTDGSLLQGAGYTIGAGNDADDVEDLIVEHYTDPERAALPFFCGEMGLGNYYFNGFYNFSLSLVFTDLSDAPSGVVQGQRASGGFTYVMPISTGSFSVFGYQFNDNFLLPNLALNTSGTSSSVDFMNDEVTIAFSEFQSRTPAMIRRLNLDGAEYSVFAAETQSRQIGFYFYDLADDQLAAIHTIGSINPYTLGSFKFDEENNMLVVGTTIISGRFERLFVNKLSSSEVSSILN